MKPRVNGYDTRNLKHSVSGHCDVCSRACGAAVKIFVGVSHIKTRGGISTRIVNAYGVCVVGHISKSVDL